MNVWEPLLLLIAPRFSCGTSLDERARCHCRSPPPAAHCCCHHVKQQAAVAETRAAALGAASGWWPPIPLAPIPSHAHALLEWMGVAAAASADMCHARATRSLPGSCPSSFLSGPKSAAGHLGHLGMCVLLPKQRGGRRVTTRSVTNHRASPMRAEWLKRVHSANGHPVRRSALRPHWAMGGMPLRRGCRQRLVPQEQCVGRRRHPANQHPPWPSVRAKLCQNTTKWLLTLKASCRGRQTGHPAMFTWPEVGVTQPSPPGHGTASARRSPKVHPARL